MECISGTTWKFVRKLFLFHGIPYFYFVYSIKLFDQLVLKEKTQIVLIVFQIKILIIFTISLLILSMGTTQRNCENLHRKGRWALGEKNIWIAVSFFFHSNKYYLNLSDTRSFAACFRTEEENDGTPHYKARILENQSISRCIKLWTILLLIKFLVATTCRCIC